MNLPNKLTIFRIVLVPILLIIPFFISTGNVINIPILNINLDITFCAINLVFIIAAITDKLDGDIARKTNQITAFGKFAAPIADKILVLAAMVLLVEFQKLPAWIPIIILTREFIVSGYRLVAVENGGEVIAANIWGKLKTVMQIVAIIIAFIDINVFGAFWKTNLTGLSLAINILATVSMISVVIITIISGWTYMKRW
jgi:CDP-diacylglycerol--glycerol-3-phosphate 3-phosphatidyltransferase